MLVLALDTATPAVTVGLVELTGGVAAVRAERRTVNPKAHGELLTPQLRAVATDTGVPLSTVAAIVCGAGPGPFTGLRVGMVTAAGLGHALDIPVYPVCSLDALAAEARHGTEHTTAESAAAATGGGGVLAVTDARRREVYWAAYDADGRRTHGPEVQRPDALRSVLPELGVTRVVGQGAELYAVELGLAISATGEPGLAVGDPAYPGVRGLVEVAAEALTSGATPAELTPLYLRRPDAVEPGARKRTGQPLAAELKATAARTRGRLR